MSAGEEGEWDEGQEAGSGYRHTQRVIPAKAGIQTTVIPAKAGIQVSRTEHGSPLSRG